MELEEFRRSRLEYIKEINCKFRSCQSALIPTTTQQRSFEEALQHIVRVVSSNGCAQAEDTLFNCDLITSSRTMSRKQCMKKILDQLHRMERERCYDPPADNEIGRYLQIKNYIRSILAFNLERDTFAGPTKFGHPSPDVALQHAEDLIDFNQYLADFSEILLKMDIKEVSTLTPLMGLKDRYEASLPVIQGSKERSYMFYHHKFRLASIDLRFSEFAFCHPHEDEKISYLQALNGIIGQKDDMNVYSKELSNLYVERFHHEIVDVERHFGKIKGWLLKNLSLIDCYDDVVQCMSTSEYKDHVIAEFEKEVAEKCEVSNEDLLNYILQVDHCLTIVRLVYEAINICAHNSSMLDAIEVSRARKQFGWDAVHALTFLRHGSSVGSVLQEQPLLQSPQKPDSTSRSSMKQRTEAESRRENVQDKNFFILDEIVDDLKCIGASNIKLDEEELALMDKIWISVESSTHFFVSAIAYEQRRYVIEHCKSFDLGMLGLPTTKLEETIYPLKASTKLDTLLKEALNLALVLKTYKNGLIEKLQLPQRLNA